MPVVDGLWIVRRLLVDLAGQRAGLVESARHCKQTGEPAPQTGKGGAAGS